MSLSVRPQWSSVAVEALQRLPRCLAERPRLGLARDIDPAARRQDRRQRLQFDAGGGVVRNGDSIQCDHARWSLANV